MCGGVSIGSTCFDQRSRGSELVSICLVLFYLSTAPACSQCTHAIESRIQPLWNGPGDVPSTW